MLVGRERETEALVGLLDGAQAGTAGTVLLTGDPGVGKTALVDVVAVLARRRGFAIASVTAVQAETRVPGALSSLILGHLGAQTAVHHIPEPSEVLQAIATRAEVTPLLVTLDDVQWADQLSLSAVTFAIRRLLADRVAVVLAGRPEVDQNESLSHLRRLEVSVLDEEDALSLLRSVVPEVVDGAGRTIVQALGRLPLALLEAPTLLPDAVLRGAELPPSPLPVGRAVQARYARGFELLQPRARAALVLMAAGESGDEVDVPRAWEVAGVAASDLEAAEADGLVTLGPPPTFVHPLVRAAVFSAATPAERRTAHRLLAELYEAGGDQARGLRHRAAASVGPDGPLASSLEAEAKRLADQGDLTGGATLARRAADLSPTQLERLQRLVLAAEMSTDAVDVEALTSTVQTGTRDPEIRARIALVRAQKPRSIGVEELDRMLRGIPRESLPRDVRVRVDVERVWATMAEADVVRLDRLDAELEGPPAEERWDLVATLGMAHTFLGRHDRGVELLRRAFTLTADVDPALLATDQLFNWAFIPAWLGEDPAQRRTRMAYMSGRLRSSGQPRKVASAAFYTAESARRDGLWDRADSLFNEAIELGRAMQVPTPDEEVRLAAAVTAYRGEADRTLQLATAAEREFEPDPSGNWPRLWADHARGALALTLGRAEEALAPLHRVASAPFLGRGCRDAVTCALVDLTEALVLVRRVTSARREADRLAGWLDGIVDPHGLALVQRCHALTRPDDADEHYRAAVALHARADDPFEAGRTLLLQGEHLRRTRRPREARDALHDALSRFQQVGATPWSERASRELGATGQAPPATAPAATSPLTPQELRVALAVVDGLSNAEVAASLFLSVKTVEFHLSRVYRKLEVRSRGGLARALERTGVRL